MKSVDDFGRQHAYYEGRASVFAPLVLLSIFAVIVLGLRQNVEAVVAIVGLYAAVYCWSLFDRKWR